jgi:hypothetical protein
MNLVTGARWVPDIKTDWSTDRRSQHNFDKQLETLCSGGSNTSTASLRVVRVDGKETQCSGVKLGKPVLREYKYGDLALQVGGVSNLSEKNTVLCPAVLGT